ncbi:MAG: DUF2400 family protein [candidate division Zixibacteria bacterium]|nr:DUF2400 family protein [candidate division Zixibacteria bacterium]
MRSQAFAGILVEELVDSDPSKGDAREFHRRNGIDPTNLKHADEIWRVFVRYNLETGGMKSRVVTENWNKLPDASMLKNRMRLLGRIVRLKHSRCYANFTLNCPVTYSKVGGFNLSRCTAPGMEEGCPFVEITKEIQWHRQHYKIAKIIVECAKRLLIEDMDGQHDGNLNDVVAATFDKYRGTELSWRAKATEEYMSRFEDIKGYGNPPKVILWMLSDLSSPVHQLEHWPDVDLSQLTPVDTHVGRLVVRFGFLPRDQVSNRNIRATLRQLYPKEPRKLDFALYRLGAESEENICRTEPHCKSCRERIPRVYTACHSQDKKDV